MTQERRKITFYLRPGISASERYADARIEAHPRSDRGDMTRTAMLAGIALGEVDSRLPSMLASLLAEGSSPEVIRKMLVSFLEIEPTAPVSVTPPVKTEPEKAPQDPGSVSAKNLASSLPD